MRYALILLSIVFFAGIAPMPSEAAEAVMVVTMTIGNTYEGSIRGLNEFGLSDIPLSVAHPDEVDFALTMDAIQVMLAVRREGSVFELRPFGPAVLSEGEVIFSIF